MVNSSVGKKFVMAATGLLLLGFVIVHMLGNLQVFLPRDPVTGYPLNAYAEKLKSLGPLLWGARLALLTVFVAHILTAIRLWTENKAARPVAYACDNTVQASVASRVMFQTGLVVLAFVIYHLAHYTLMIVDTSYASMIETLPGGHQRPHVQAMVIKGFRNPVVTATYVFAQLLLGFHVCHGASSMFQSVGLTCKKCKAAIQLVGPLIATVIVAGNIAIPIAILFRLVG